MWDKSIVVPHPTLTRDSAAWSRGVCQCQCASVPVLCVSPVCVYPERGGRLTVWLVTLQRKPQPPPPPDQWEPVGAASADTDTLRRVTRCPPGGRDTRRRASSVSPAWGTGTTGQVSPLCHHCDLLLHTGQLRDCSTTIIQQVNLSY